MLRHILLSLSRSTLIRSTTKPHLQSFYACILRPSTRKLHVQKANFPGEQETNDDDNDDDDNDMRHTATDRCIRETLSLVATQAITPQHAIRCITTLAKNQTQGTLSRICAILWEHSVSASRKSKTSAVLIANFLIRLSHQSQEDFEDQLQDSAHSPTIVTGYWGDKERLWHDMPGMWELLDRMSDVYPDHDFEDSYFFSLLFRSRQRAFDGLDLQLVGIFPFAAHWPLHQDEYDDWKIAIQAILRILDTAGARLKEKVLDNHPNEWRMSVGQWYRWQKGLFRIAADAEIASLEYRALAKQAADIMTIQRHLTNHWWRRWRTKLSEITADPTQDSSDRIMAKQINEILTCENEEQEAAMARLLPMLPPSPLLLPPPGTVH